MKRLVAQGTSAVQVLGRLSAERQQFKAKAQRERAQALDVGGHTQKGVGRE